MVASAQATNDGSAAPQPEVYHCEEEESADDTQSESLVSVDAASMSSSSSQTIVPQPPIEVPQSSELEQSVASSQSVASTLAEPSLAGSSPCETSSVETVPVETSPCDKSSVETSVEEAPASSQPVETPTSSEVAESPDCSKSKETTANSPEVESLSQSAPSQLIASPEPPIELSSIGELTPESSNVVEVIPTSSSIELIAQSSISVETSASSQPTSVADVSFTASESKVVSSLSEQLPVSSAYESVEQPLVSSASESIEQPPQSSSSAQPPAESNETLSSSVSIQETTVAEQSLIPSSSESESVVTEDIYLTVVTGTKACDTCLESLITTSIPVEVSSTIQNSTTKFVTKEKHPHVTVTITCDAAACHDTTITSWSVDSTPVDYTEVEQSSVPSVAAVSSLEAEVTTTYTKTLEPTEVSCGPGEACELKTVQPAVVCQGDDCETTTYTSFINVYVTQSLSLLAGNLAVPTSLEFPEFAGAGVSHRVSALVLAMMAMPIFL